MLKRREDGEVSDLVGAACDRFLRSEEDALMVLNEVAAGIDDAC